MNIPRAREAAADAVSRLELRAGDVVRSSKWGQDREVLSCGAWGIEIRAVVDRSVTTLKSVPADLEIVLRREA